MDPVTPPPKGTTTAPGRAHGHLPHHADNPDVRAAIKALAGLQLAEVTDLHGHGEPDTNVYGALVQPRGNGSVSVSWLWGGQDRDAQGRRFEVELEILAMKFREAGWDLKTRSPFAVHAVRPSLPSSEAPTAFAAEPRDWAVLAVTTSVLGAASRETAEEIAEDGDHLTLITRTPGQDWEFATSPGKAAQYAFTVGDTLHAGTLKDYARHWADAQTGADAVSPHVRTWAGAPFTVAVAYLGTDKQGRAWHQLNVGNDAAHATHNTTG